MSEDTTTGQEPEVTEPQESSTDLTLEDAKAEIDRLNKELRKNRDENAARRVAGKKAEEEKSELEQRVAALETALNTEKTENLKVRVAEEIGLPKTVKEEDGTEYSITQFMKGGSEDEIREFAKALKALHGKAPEAPPEPQDNSALMRAMIPGRRGAVVAPPKQRGLSAGDAAIRAAIAKNKGHG